MAIDPSSGSPADADEYGLYARSFFWYVQSMVLSAVAIVALLMSDTGPVGIGLALFASYGSAYLLFRQIDLLVEKKLPE